MIRIERNTDNLFSLLQFIAFVINTTFPHGALLALGGRSSPECTVHSGLSPRPFCVEFACSPRVHKGFPPLRTATEYALSCPSLTKMDGSLHLVPGRLKKSCPLLLGSWRKDSPGWDKCRSYIHKRPQACVCVCVCVCVLCRLHVFTCVAVCCLCDNYNYNKMYQEAQRKIREEE